MSSWDLKHLQAALGSSDSNKELDYCFKDATTLGQLVSLTALTKLNVSFNLLSNLKGISSLAHLQHLNVSHNRLTSIEGVSALPGLTQFVCSHNKIRSVRPVTCLARLQFFALHNNLISTAADALSLSSLTRLKHLTLSHNPVCKQHDWQGATIASLPSLEALDSTWIGHEQRTAAAGCSWTTADVPADTSSTPGDSACEDDRGDKLVSTRCGADVRRSSRSSAGRLRPRVAPATSTAAFSDSMHIKDVAGSQALPGSSSSPAAHSIDPHNPPNYGYSRTKPVTVLRKQLYAGSGTAVSVFSDGGANLNWPEGTMAATLVPEDPPPIGSTSGSSCSSSSVAPIRGYRMLAMYRTATGVAASFDSSGGFAQWPNGQLMLVWNRREGTAYSPDGRITHRFTGKRKSPGSLKEDIVAVLDEHLSLRFRAGSHDVELALSCEGHTSSLSQQHGAVPLDGAAAVPAHCTAPCGAAKSCSTTACNLETQEQTLQQDTATPSSAGAASRLGPAVAGLPGADEMQALLARARALMAATELPATGGQHAVDALAASLAVAAGARADKDTEGFLCEDASSSCADCGVSACDRAELQAMMAQARSAIAATSAALHGLEV